MGQGPSTPGNLGNVYRREDCQRSLHPLHDAGQLNWAHATGPSAVLHPAGQNSLSTMQGNLAAHLSNTGATPPMQVPVVSNGGSQQRAYSPSTGLPITNITLTPANAVPGQPVASNGGNAGNTATGPNQTANTSRVPAYPVKHANLIPVFSKGLSSTALALDGQRCSHPCRSATPADTYAVLELEVMKFVAYCGGLSLSFRLDEVPAGTCEVSWGIASTKPCPTLTVEVVKGGNETGSQNGSNDSACRGRCISNPTASNQIDNPARKSFYTFAGTTSLTQPQAGDILSMEFAPHASGHPFITAVLKLNSHVLLEQSLPCASLSLIQLHPFLTLLPGMSASLYEATTPSPLFTWFHSPGNLATPDIHLQELDTCIRCATNTTAPEANRNVGGQIELLGSTTFSSGRVRWTVQLDNWGAVPCHVYVGVAMCALNHVTSVNASAGALAYGQGPLRPITSNHTSNAGAPGSSTSVLNRNSTTNTSVAGVAPWAARNSTHGASSGGVSATEADQGDTRARVPRGSLGYSGGGAPPTQWGAWIKLPGVAPVGNNFLGPPPARDGLVHITEATSNHCYVTVDLDMTSGFMRVFRNGHTIGQTFTGLTGTVCPVVAFVQGTSMNCQLGLVNITKLRQLDLAWTLHRCSADLQLAGHVVTKVSEVYGDYSTVLADQGFTSGVHLWSLKVNNLAEADSIFIGVSRGCMPLDSDPQDLRDRTYYLSNGVIRVGGRRVVTNAAQFSKGDTVTVVLDADQGEIVFFRNGMEQGRARGIRGRLYPFVSCDSENDQVTMVCSYSLKLDRIPRILADMEWDTQGSPHDIELSANCLTATKTSSSIISTITGSTVYSGSGVHEFHVILDVVGPDGICVGLIPADANQPLGVVGDPGCGWGLHSDGDKRYCGRDEEFCPSFKNGDVVTVTVDLGHGTLRFGKNGLSLGEAFTGITGKVVPAVTLVSEESKVTIQNRPTVLNTDAYAGDLRWDDARAGRDLLILDGLTVTKMGNDGGDYATVLGTLCLASGQHSWGLYINHVEDSNLFIGVSVGGHDLNADPQEMKHRTYYLSNGTIRVAGKLVTRCAEPYGEGDVITVQLDMEAREITFLKNGNPMGKGDGLPEEVWPYVSLDNVMDSITLHSSNMFIDLIQSVRWNPAKCCKAVALSPDSSIAQLGMLGREETLGQGTVLGLREYIKPESHTWVVRLEQSVSSAVANFLVGVAPPDMDCNKSLGEAGCGIGLDYYGYFYVNGKYFHVSNLGSWRESCKQVRGSTAKHKGKSQPVVLFKEGKCEITITLDLKEHTLRFSHAGRNIGIISDVKGPLHAAITLTSSRMKAALGPGPIGKSEHSNEELVTIIKGKGVPLSPRMEAAMLLVPRVLFVPRDRQREAFRDQKVTVRTSDGSTMTLPPPSFVAIALEKLGVGTTARSFLDVGCGSGYVTALAACLLGDHPNVVVQGIECIKSRLDAASGNLRTLKDQLTTSPPLTGTEAPGSAVLALCKVALMVANVLTVECTNGATYDAIYCDVSVTEEELPVLLSLLKPGGKLACLIEEEAVLVTRGNSTSDAHDYTREAIQTLVGEYGSLEDPTPWEAQEAINRLKERERKRGHDQAKQDVAMLRNFEYVEMQQRVQVAMQRIAELEIARAELENALAATRMEQNSVRSAPRSPARGVPRSPARGSLLEHQFSRSPGRTGAVDDVRIAIRDKERRGQSHKLSPRAVPLSHQGSHLPPSPGATDADADWKPSMYNAINDNSPMPLGVHTKSLSVEQLSEPDQGAMLFPNSELLFEDNERDQVDVDNGDLSDPEDLVPGMENNSPMLPPPFLMGPQSQIHAAHQIMEDIIDSLSVQTFTPEQIATMIGQSVPTQIENRDVFSGTYKGVRVRVWRLNVSHHAGLWLDLKRAYSKYCIAHPNIAAVLGVCIQQSGVPVMSSVDFRRAASMPCPSPLSKCTYARSLPDGSWLNIANRAVADGNGDVTPSHDLMDGNGTDCQSVFEDEEPTGASTPTLLRSPDRQAASALAAISQHPPLPSLTHHTLWIVEECFGDETLHTRIERGLLNWKQVCRIATDICKALAFLQDLKRYSAPDELYESFDGPFSSRTRDDSFNLPRFGSGSEAHRSAVLSAYALRTIVTPANVLVNAQTTKVSVLPALLASLESVVGDPLAAPLPPTQAPLHCDLAYIDPYSLLSEASANVPTFYAFGMVQLQLLTEQGPLGLRSAVKEALDSNTLANLIPRIPLNSEMSAWAVDFARSALKCMQLGADVALEDEILPTLETLAQRLDALGGTSVSWEQVEEMLMLPLQPRGVGEHAAARRWVRQDFRIRRKMFMDEVAKLAAEGPVHKVEVRRGRCFKDSIAVFAGKGQAVWKQPLKVTFIGEQGMDSGGVSREWFSALSSSISRGSPELFLAAGPQKNQLYINPLSAAPSHLKKFHFIGLFMAKAILESSARGKELGPITLNLPFCEPLWKLLLGIPLNLTDLQLLDPTEFRSLMSLLDMDIDGLIFENFAWEFHDTPPPPPANVAAAGFGVGAGYVAPVSTTPTPANVATHASNKNTTPAGQPQSSAMALSPHRAPNIRINPNSPVPGPSSMDNEPGTPTASPAAHSFTSFLPASPVAQGGFGFDDGKHCVSIPLKPGGNHMKVTNQNKREYVLLKAHKMLVGTIEQQMTAVIDAFHSIIPRDLIDKYSFTSLELQLLVCGEQRIDIQDLQRNCKYEDGYCGKEPIIGWFWEVAEGFDDTLRRQLLQFWSGSDGMPAEGFAAMDPAFHMVAVERLYDAADTTARLPTAHTCFRQLDLPRYKSAEELKEKLVTAITIGQVYMALT